MCGCRLVVVVSVLLGMVLAVSPALAAGRPDLVARSVSSPPASAKPGASFRIVVTVANAGARRARASALAFVLSRDARRDAKDIRVKARKARVRALGRHKKARVRVTLRLPRRVPAGRYRLLACADGRGKVRERRETNNCRSAKRRLRVGGGAVPELPAFKPAPLDVTPALDAAHATTQTVTSDGATLTATGADGATYVLTLPKDAVAEPQSITMTPIASIGSFPFSKGFGGGVQLEPDGLRLGAAAKLVITPPSPVPSEQRAAFSYTGAGKDFHLEPTTFEPATIEYELIHFSAYGWGKATAKDRAAQGERVPSSREGWARQNVAIALQEAHEASARGDASVSDRWVNAMEIALYVWGNEGVLPELTAATTDDARFERAQQEYLGWERTVQLTHSEPDGKLGALSATLKALWLTALEHARTAADVRCRDNKDPFQYRRMIALERFTQLLGFPPDPNLVARLDACLRFELRGTFDLTFAYDDSDPFSQGTTSGTFTIPIRPFAQDFKSVADPVLTAASLDSTDPGATWAWGGTATITKPMEVRKLDIDWGTPGPTGEMPKPKVVLGLDWGILLEDGTITGCSDGLCQTAPGPSGIHNLAVGSLYVGAAGGDGMTTIQDWDVQQGAGNEVFATKTRDRSLHGAIPGTGTEHLELQLVHTPA
ncbi:MAG TPA: CARDB domain-containing protein [Baekduia sp.]|nr:CARDB domain-containing protein [Baekduia sp.]